MIFLFLFYFQQYAPLYFLIIFFFYRLVEKNL